MPSRDLARAAAFARMSEDIMGEGDVRSTLQRVVHRCVAAVPACDHASVSLHRRKGSDRIFAGSSPLAERCLRLQQELGEGPSVEAWTGGDPNSCVTPRTSRAGHGGAGRSPTRRASARC